MKLTRDDVRTLARVIDLDDIPEDDLNIIALRLSSLLEAMVQIEAELGAEMDKIDPIPPVFPREDF
jgi:hypothetical protein